MTQTETLISAAEAAALLGIDRSTLTRWVKAGRVEAAHKNPHQNGALLFELATVEALLAERAS